MSARVKAWRCIAGRQPTPIRQCMSPMVRCAAALWCATLWAACATPLPPGGGPPDDTPPHIVESIPAAGATNVSEASLRIVFAEHINESSFRQALSIIPEPETPPELDWRGPRVDIRLADPLRDSTTYVFTLDTGLRDLHGIALAAPIILAFSTGPTLNAGVLTGRVVHSHDGAPAPGVDVLAYAAQDGAPPDSLPARPAYRTQTDPDGVFRFEYMTERDWFVAALDDANYNARPDPGESFAPPPVPVLLADTVQAALKIPWMLTRIDTVRSDSLRVPTADPETEADTSPEAVPLEETGEILGVVVSGEPHPVVVETWPDTLDIRQAAPPYQAVADSAGSFLLPRLPAGAYQLRAWLDRNENGRWDKGMLTPYRPPEPAYFMTEPVRVRARWETTLPDTLRIPAAVPIP